MVSPAGLFTLPIDYLRETVAGSATFQTWVGAANQAAAKVHVYPFEVSFSGDDANDRKTDYASLLPFAIVDWNQSFSRNQIAGGSRNFFEQEGDLGLQFFMKIEENDDTDAAYAFTNKIGAIVKEMEELSGTASYLNIVNISLANGPVRSGKIEEESLEFGVYHIDFNVEFAGL